MITPEQQVLNDLSDMIASPLYAARRPTLRQAERVICDQAERIRDLEQALRDSLGRAVSCVNAWDGKFWDDGGLDTYDIGADIRKQLQLGETQ